MLNDRTSVLTPTAIHAARRHARRTLLRLRILRPALERTALPRLRQSLRDLIEFTAPSRDAEVQHKMVLQLMAALPKQRARHCQALVRELDSRQAVALARMEADLGGTATLRQQRQQNADLRQLQRVQSAVDLPGLATRRYRRALRTLDKQLAKSIPTGRRVHRLRIRLRRACDLAALVHAPRELAASRLPQQLDRMQEALGELHDGQLFITWAAECDVALPRPLRQALDRRARRCLKRLQRQRKPLRHALHDFLKPES